MPIVRRIYVSLPADPWLPKNLNDLKWGIVEEIEKLGYATENRSGNVHDSQGAKDFALISQRPPRIANPAASVALYLNRRLWPFTALNSALTQFWCSIMDDP